MDELADPIMERNFESLDAAGNSGTIKLLIGKPYLKPDARWSCPFQIIGMNKIRNQQAPGLDSIDTVLNAMVMAKILLDSYIRRYEIKIMWQGDDYLGLYELPDFEPSDHDKRETEFDFQKIFDEFFANFTPKKRQT